MSDDETSRFTASCWKAEEAALRLIARAEQSSLGLTAKLVRKGFSADEVRTVVSSLLDRNLINNERYAELWVRSRLSQGKSPNWLFSSLLKRGIDRKSALSALEKVLDPETEHELLLKFVEKAGISGHAGEIFPRKRLKSEGFSSNALDAYYCIL